MKRRDLIKYGITGLGYSLTAGGLPINLAFGQNANREPHFFILVRAPGGIHSAMGLDPIFQSSIEARKISVTDDREQFEYYKAYRESDIIIGSANGNQIPLGPGARALMPHLSDIAIVNGIMQLPNTPVHQSNLHYISSGDSNLSAPAFPFQLLRLASQQQSRGVHDLQYALNSMIGGAPNVINLADIKNILTHNAGDIETIDKILANSSTRSNDPFISLLKDRADNSNTYENFAKLIGGDITGSQSRVAQEVINLIRENSRQEITNIAFLINRYGGPDRIRRRDIEDIGFRAGSPSRLVSSVLALYREDPVYFNTIIQERGSESSNKDLAAAMGSGLIQYATLDFTGAFDAHSGYPDRHRDEVNNVLNRFTRLMDEFKNAPVFIDGEISASKSLYDCTTFMFCTDFSRSPWKQDDSGTDHNPRTNSILLAGKGIKGGQVVGSSYYWGSHQTSEGQSRLQALPYDYRNGLHLPGDQMSEAIRDEILKGQCTAIENGERCLDYIFPENIYATIVQAMNLDDKPSTVLNKKVINKLLA